MSPAPPNISTSIRTRLRYRLRRIEEVSGVTLDDPGERFELMLEFRVRQSLGDSHAADLTVRRGQSLLGPAEFRSSDAAGVR